MLSVFDIFKIGIGPSSSHTVGPMRAAGQFVEMLERDGLLWRTARVSVSLYGSLGATGRGHATDLGVILGLCGQAPDTVEPAIVKPLLADMQRSCELPFGGHRGIDFQRTRDIVFRGEETLPWSVA